MRLGVLMCLSSSRKENAELHEMRALIIRDQEMVCRENERLLRKLADVERVCSRSPIQNESPLFKSFTGGGGTAPGSRGSNSESLSSSGTFNSSYWNTVLEISGIDDPNKVHASCFSPKASQDEALSWEYVLPSLVSLAIARCYMMIALIKSNYFNLFPQADKTNSSLTRSSASNKDNKNERNSQTGAREASPVKPPHHLRNKPANRSHTIFPEVA